MSVFFVLCCLAVCFTPTLFIFHRLVSPDPLRIILFVLGAFFWLLSSLLTSFVFAICGTNLLLVPVFVSILFQEAARAAYFMLMYKAQSELARLASDDGSGEVSGLRLMYSSRHILAIVCGLGMGTMAALFHLTNILASYWDDGVVGLPAAVAAANNVTQSGTRLLVSDAYFPLYYSISCSLMIMLQVMWSISIWDALHRCFHKIGSRSLWICSALFTIIAHFANTTMSLWLRELPFLVFGLQLVLLLCCAFHSVLLIKNTSPAELFQRPRRSSAGSDVQQRRS